MNGSANFRLDGGHGHWRVERNRGHRAHGSVRVGASVAILESNGPLSSDPAVDIRVSAGRRPAFRYPPLGNGLEGLAPHAPKLYATPFGLPL